LRVGASCRCARCCCEQAHCGGQAQPNHLYSVSTQTDTYNDMNPPLKQFGPNTPTGHDTSTWTVARKATRQSFIWFKGIRTPSTEENQYDSLKKISRKPYIDRLEAPVRKRNVYWKNMQRFSCSSFLDQSRRSFRTHSQTADRTRAKSQTSHSCKREKDSMHSREEWSDFFSHFRDRNDEQTSSRRANESQKRYIERCETGKR
jgi:hypothetical protein